MYEALEKPEEQEGEEVLEEFTQKEIAEMATIPLNDVHKGDFAKINGEFRGVERIEYPNPNDCWVITLDGGRYRSKLVRVYKKNPGRP
jgi:hypothetical protein